MRYKNPGFLPIQKARQYVRSANAGMPDTITALETPFLAQMDYSLDQVTSSSWKILHPLFYESYRMPVPQHSDELSPLVGFDVETEAIIGLPKLFGTYHPELGYRYAENPTLEWFYQYIREIKANLIAWGTLDLQSVLRLFEPTEKERVQISRGITGRVLMGEFAATPPIMRSVGSREGILYVGAYIPGRALKIGLLEKGCEMGCWVFNGHQFYPGTIAQTAKGLGIPWIDYAKDTHIIDWHRFATDAPYKEAAIASNRQDAKTVYTLSQALADSFKGVFNAAPKHLISTGSLCDAAVAALCSKEEYSCQNLEWLARNIWAKNSTPEAINELRILCSECFSAGYVDQYAIGYCPKVKHADIAAAYPAQIRQLHDLRHSYVVKGSGDPEQANLGIVEGALIRGTVTIPRTLQFHPITVKTRIRQNIRPTGTFRAGYTLDERRYAQKFGAKFANESWVMVILKKVEPAPLAKVSIKLGEMRDAYRARFFDAVSDEEKATYDGMQYMIKLVDNSLYGKTVMTTERVENNAEMEPEIIGYTPGDRFNPFWGALITARTRCVLSEAAMAVTESGGKVIMCMTDSLFWYGDTNIPAELIRQKKTPGYFEPSDTLEDFFLIKTGQYEYHKNYHWTYKLRGLPINYEILRGGKESFYRRVIQEWAEANPLAHAPDVRIPIETKRLISIGAHDLEHLASISEGITVLKPFQLSGKQDRRELKEWRSALDSLIPLQTPRVGNTDPSHETPYVFFSALYAGQLQANPWYVEPTNHRATGRTRKRAFILERAKEGISPPPVKHQSHSEDLSWNKLHSWYGISKRNE